MVKEVINSLLPQTPEITAVIAAYDVAPYLPAFFASLDTQSCCEADVEYIIVDDASSDGTFDAILAWALGKRNVRVLRNETNIGAALTREIGYGLARGTWVTSVDPDDILDGEYFSAVLSIAHSDKNDEVDILTTRVATYNERLGLAQFNHPLDFKYREGQRVVDLLSEPRAIQLGATAFLRTAILRQCNIHFDARVKPTFEDGHLIARYLLEIEKPVVALVSEAIYYYRDRLSQDSLVSSAWQREEKYRDEIRYGYIPLLEDAQARYGVVPRWLENLILYQLTWQFFEAGNPRGANAWMTRQPGLREDFFALVEHVFTLISPQALMEFSIRNISVPLRGTLLAHYYGADGTKAFAFHEGEHRTRVFIAGNSVSDVVVEPIRARGNTAELVSRAHFLFGVLFAYEVQVSTSVGDTVTFRGKPIPHVFGQPSNSDNGLRTPPSAQDSAIARLSGTSGGISGIVSVLKTTLRLVKLPRNPQLPAPFLPIAKKIVEKFPVLIRRVGLKLALGIVAFIDKFPFCQNPYRDAWLVMDRMNGANDNGEHFYRFLRDCGKQENVFFMIGRKSADYQRLKNSGFRILPQNVFAVAQALRHSQVIIASDWAADDLAYVWNIRSSVASTPLVFLQHGITKDDISHWLNGLGLSMIVTTLPQEQEYLTAPDSPYNFKKGEAVRTGMPRYDRLFRLAEEAAGVRGARQTRLMVMPTWRNTLRDLLRDLPDTEKHKAFTKSELYHQWCAFLNDPQVTELLADSSLRIDFVLHPNLVLYLDDFDLPNEVHRHDIRTMDFQAALAKADLFVTDYSSAAFDAVIADCGVTYFQFDKAEFFGGGQSMSPGWFDYERDGYGPVHTDSEHLASWVYEIVKGDDEAGESEYRRRRRLMRDSVPREACERTYQEIKRRYGNSR